MEWAHVIRFASVAIIVLTGSSCSASRPCNTASTGNPEVTDPPRPCRVDGCSLAPDFDFGYCCDEHDVRYWSGGTAEQRQRTDRAFRECIVEAGHPFKAGLYYYAVRAGGTPHLPTSWRWGFGWDYPRGYTELPETPDSDPEQAR